LALWLYLFWCLTSAAWVWLALSPVGQQAPEWLLRTRELCFGTLENGLPDVHGWITLAAPLPMLLALFSLMGQDFKSQVGRLWRSWPGPLVVLLLLGLPSATMTYLGWRYVEAPRFGDDRVTGSLPANYPQVDELCPIPALQDQFGQTLTGKQLLGSVTLLTFAYSHCQTVCPSLMENLAVVAKTADCRVMVVTLDPRRDTCGSLGGLAHLWSLPAGSRILGGEVEQVEAALAAFSMTIERNLQTGEILHPALVLVLDTRGHIRYRLNSPSQVWLQDAVARVRAVDDTP